MEGFQIHIKGRVQGVGFRPFVYNLAKAFHLKGSVKNTASGVFIDLLADEAITNEFVAALKDNPPEKSIIESIAIKSIDQISCDDFHIIDSSFSDEIDLKISPDFAICSNCLEELSSEADRRYNYAFITCSECGPRYSIQKELPYDREGTTMEMFGMCSSCRDEYDDPSDRRFYSQTNSCPDCGISLYLFDGSKELTGLSQNELIDFVCFALHRGEIVAVKGIGGYLLLCDPTNASAVQTLRNRKNRPDKPFALLFPDADEIKKVASLSKREEALMKSEVSPIVLLEREKEATSGICWELVSPRLPTIGAMLPYAPLLKLVVDKFDHPLIATSGNISGGPIIFNDDEARKELSNIADFILTHNREILIPQDDSVASVSGQKVIWIRRSRGLAPSYFGALPENLENGVLALGAHMKSSFALSQSNNWHISQYLGSLDGYESQNTYRHTLSHFRSLLKTPIHKVLTDNHPVYFVNALSRELAEKENITTDSYQHHQSHFAAVLQENDLIDEQDVLGIIWDGTGWGNDGNSWGGECFTYQNYEMTRAFHVNYVPVIANDKMAKEPRLSACAFCSEMESARELLKKKFTPLEWKNYQNSLLRKSTQTSSMGRLFDGVASLIGLIDVTTYEGQAAMLLEATAKQFTNEITVTYSIPFDNHIIQTDHLFEAIIQDLKNKRSQSYIAKKFHLSLVQLIRQIADHLSLKKIAFSGGVFQNGLLMAMLQNHLSEDYLLYFHKELPPNDENISFGQLAQYHLQQVKDAALNHENYVSSDTW